MWDYVKNSGTYKGVAEHLEADWIGMLPGKRESRRYVGDHILTQQDIRAEGRFHDVIAYGGWNRRSHCSPERLGPHPRESGQRLAWIAMRGNYPPVFTSRDLL